MTKTPLPASPRKRGEGSLFLAILALFVLSPASATARSVRVLESVVQRPIAVRGGVLLVPLRIRKDGEQWPVVQDLELDGGQRLRGQVAWLSVGPPAPVRGWTDDPRRVQVRWIAPDDGPPGPAGVSQRAPGAPYLIARLPEDGHGSLRLGRQRLEPIWTDPPASRTEPAPSSFEPLERPAWPRPDRPDGRSSLEYWRWVLLAASQGRRPPPPDVYGEAGDLVAQHYADLWQIGLDRLDVIAPDLGSQCRALLTRLCQDRSRDRDTRFAAWIADPQHSGVLLNLLLDDERPDDNLREAVRGWLHDREPVLTWLEAGDDEQVHLVMVNRTREPLIAKFVWEDGHDIPIAVELPGGELTTAVIDRSPRDGAAGDGTPPLAPGAGREVVAGVLQIMIGSRTYHLPVGPRRLVARPPGAFFQTLRPVLTLAEVEAGVLLPGAEDRATFVHVRRLDRRWEVFFDCRRPILESEGPGSPAPAWTGGGASVPARLPTGIEAVTLGLGTDGDEGDPQVQLVVPEIGSFQLRQGEDDGTLEVHRRSYGDRWYCRIVLTDAWTAGGQQMAIGCARTFGGSPAFQVAPGTATPWRQVLGRAVIDLSQWEDLPE